MEAVLENCSFSGHGFRNYLLIGPWNSMAVFAGGTVALAASVIEALLISVFRTVHFCSGRGRFDEFIASVLYLAVWTFLGFRALRYGSGSASSKLGTDADKKKERQRRRTIATIYFLLWIYVSLVGGSDPVGSALFSNKN